MRLTEKDIKKIVAAAGDMRERYDVGRYYQSWQDIEIMVEGGMAYIDCTLQMVETPCSHRDPYLPDDGELLLDSLTIDNIALYDADGNSYEIEDADNTAIDAEIERYMRYN
jgi:hypothetical protein